MDGAAGSPKRSRRSVRAAAPHLLAPLVLAPHVRSHKDALFQFPLSFLLSSKLPQLTLGTSTCPSPQPPIPRDGRQGPAAILPAPAWRGVPCPRRARRSPCWRSDVRPAGVRPGPAYGLPGWPRLSPRSRVSLPLPLDRSSDAACVRMVLTAAWLLARYVFVVSAVLVLCGIPPFEGEPVAKSEPLWRTENPQPEE